MPKFLRRITPKDGDAFTQATREEVIAQKAKEVNGEIIILEARRNVLGKTRAERQELIAEAKAEVEKLYCE